MNKKSRKSSNNNNKPKALLFCFESWREHTFLLAMLGYSYESLGFEPIFINCDGLLLSCELGIPDKNTCDRCTFSNISTLIEMGFENIISSQQFIDSETAKQISIDFEKAKLNDVLNTKIGKTHLSEILRYSIRNGTRSESLMLNEGEHKMWKNYGVSAKKIRAVVENAVSFHNPSSVAVVNGSSFAKRIIYEFSRCKDIDVTSIEFGSLKKTIIAVNDVLRKFAVSEADMNRIELTPDFIDKTENHFTERMTIMRDYFSTSANDSKIKKDNRKLVSLFTTLGWEIPPQDDRIFSSQIEWITRSIRYAESRPNILLVIRIHPSEIKFQNNELMKDVIDYHFPILPTNVQVITPHQMVNSYAIIQDSDAVLINTSTIGIEAAMLKKPPIVVGDIYFKGHDISYDLDENLNYERLIDRVLNNDPTLSFNYNNALKIYYKRIIKEIAPYFDFDKIIRSEINLHYPGSNKLTVSNDAKIDSDDYKQIRNIMRDEVSEMTKYLSKILGRESIEFDEKDDDFQDKELACVNQLMNYYFSSGNIQIGEALHDLYITMTNGHYPYTLYPHALNMPSLEYPKHFNAESEEPNA